MPNAKNNYLARSNLSRALKMSLSSQGSGMLSSSKLANEFNLRAIGAATITPETMRKWRSGAAMPSAGHLVVLREWLKLDLNAIFSKSEKNESFDEWITDPLNGKALSNNAALETLDETIKFLLNTRKTMSVEIKANDKRLANSRKKAS